MADGKRTTTRVYLVSVGDKEYRLVRAVSVAQARNHVAESLLTTRVALVEDVYVLAGNGVKIEEAG